MSTFNLTLAEEQVAKQLERQFGFIAGIEMKCIFGRAIARFDNIRDAAERRARELSTIYNAQLPC